MRLLAVALALLLVGGAVAQPALDTFDALRASADITNQLARRDVDGAAKRQLL